MSTQCQPLIPESKCAVARPFPSSSEVHRAPWFVSVITPKNAINTRLLPRFCVVCHGHFSSRNAESPVESKKKKCNSTVATTVVVVVVRSPPIGERSSSLLRLLPLTRLLVDLPHLRRPQSRWRAPGLHMLRPLPLSPLPLRVPHRRRPRPRRTILRQDLL